MRYIITFLATATPALAEVPQVVTDIPPVHSLVAQVMGDLGQPELLLAKGADEHDFQLRPSQAGAVAGAFEAASAERGDLGNILHHEKWLWRLLIRRKKLSYSN